MTNLAICPTCRALTPDTNEDVAVHRKKAHTEPAADIERARKAASDAETALKIVNATVRDVEKAIDQRPVPIEPEINLRVVDDDEIDDLDDAPAQSSSTVVDDEDDPISYAPGAYFQTTTTPLT